MSKTENYAAEIIRRFGGQSALGDLIGKRQSTIQHWVKTGRIPSQWHSRLIDLARKRGISLEAGDLVDSIITDIEPSDGKLGILIVGLGAVASTFIAGV